MSTTSEQREAADARAAEFCGDMTSTAEAIDAIATALDARIEVPTVGMVEGLDEQIYHSDPCAVPSLSSSIANVMLTKCPRHAHHVHPRLGGHRRKASKAMGTGSIIHSVLLGGAPLAIVEAPDWRTKKAQLRKASAIAAGKLPILKKDAAEIQTAVDSIRAQLREHNIELGDDNANALNEVALFWEAPTSDGRLVQCRSLLDQLEIFDAPRRAVITDLKSTRSAHPRDIERHVDNYGYDVQAAAYVQAVEAIRPDLVGRVEYRWAFVELDGPCVVTPADQRLDLVELGGAKWQRAVDMWADCTASDHWPGYVKAGETARIGALPWAMKREMGTVDREILDLAI